VTEQLRALVPGWVEWFGPVLFLAGLAVIIRLVPIAAVRANIRRLDPAEHWAAQARFVHAARVSVVWAAAMVPAGIWLLSTITIGSVGWLPAWVFGLAGVAVAVLVVARVSWRMERSALQQPVPGWERYLGGFLVRLLPLAAIIVLALAAPARLASLWMMLWVLLALAVAFSLRFQLESLVGFGLADSADERLTAIVGQAAVRAGVDVPSVFIIEHHQPNAFAFPWRGKVAFTSRAVAELSEDELESVALHELGHLAESVASSRLRQATHFVWVPLAAIKPILGSLGSTGLLVVVAILAGLLIVVRRFATRMEARSDEHVVANLDESGTYGKALEKIYRIGLIPAVLRRPSHGQLKERLATAGLVIDFDPPAPPSMRALTASTLAAVLVGLAILVAPYLATVGADLSSPTPAHVALALGTYGSWSFERLGQLADLDRDLEAAEVFYAAAAEASTDPDPLLDLVYVRSVLGRCGEAEDALASLRQSNSSRGDVSLATEWVDWCREQWGDSF
jgi:Zn-dependent protease with chaperone function